MTRGRWVAAVFRLEAAEEKAMVQRKRRPRWQINADRARAEVAWLRASDTLDHADGDETKGFRCEVTMNQKLAMNIDHPSAYGPPPSTNTFHAMMASVLLEGMYVGDLP